LTDLLRTLLPFTLLISTLGFTQNVGGNGVQPTEAMNGEVALDTLDINLNIPLLTKPGIGLPLSLVMSYNSNVWQGPAQWEPSGDLFWAYPLNQFGSLGGYFEEESVQCNVVKPYVYKTGYTAYVDPTGSVHAFASALVPNSTSGLALCPVATSISYQLPDGSGITVNLSTSGTFGSVVMPSGMSYNFNSWSASPTVADANGNTISVSGGVITDTLGVAAEVTITGTPASGAVTYSYPTSTGTVDLIVNFADETLATDFGCSGVTEFPSTSGYYFPTSVSLPDGSSYLFAYESQVSGTITGRITSITYPSGEVVSYQYTGSNHGTSCTDGSVVNLTRTVTGDAVYQYTRNTATLTTTLVNDYGTGLANNTNVYTFVHQPYSGPGYYDAYFLTEEVINQGGSTPLLTKVFCYNGNQTGCPTATAPTLPLTQTDVYTTFAGTSTSSRVSKTFDSYMNVTKTAVYDFGATTPTRQVVAGPYGYTWNGSTSSPTCTTQIGSGVNNKPCQVQLQSGSGGSGTQLRNSYFQYGTTTFTGSLLSKAVLTSVSANTYLTMSATYNTNGTLATSLDANWNKTTYTEGACNNGFLTKVVPPISTLDTQYTWDSGCNGAKMMSATDPTGFSVSGTYNDPFWRPTSTTDQLTNTVNISYYPTVPINTQEAQMTFSAGSSGTADFDSFNTADALGRPLYAQKIEQSGGSWDTTQMGYSWSTTGLVTSNTMPCATTKGSGCANGVTTATGDALGRTLLVSDGGGGTVTNTYTGSSTCTSPLTGCYITTSTLGPAPTGEVVKTVAKEYNGLGQLLASCAISSASGSAACGFGGYTGFLTSYTYNADGTVATVVRGSQIHSFTYDALGRKLYATYPESGTKYFYYDSAPSTPGVACSATALLTNSSPLGNLLKTYDANKTTTCFSYDTMNRNTSIAYAGTNWDGENKYFTYDSATVDGVVMSTGTIPNTLARLAEAYTAPTASGTKVTDEGFSYTARGQVSNFYQWSTNSAGWYVTSATYLANGALNTLDAVNAAGTDLITGPWTYGLDGKGRPYSSKNSASGTMIGSVTYNVADSPCVVTLGLGDADTYIYDGNYNGNTVCGPLTTGRMTSYAFSIGATPVTTTGTYSWNANGSLNGLAIVDGINTSNTETCAYGTSSTPGYDSLGRLLSAVCVNSGGTNVWGQAFSYDMYDNVTKSVPTGDTGISWTPVYSATNNQYTPSPTYTYDSNGNVLTDTFHTYTWNQDNQPRAFTDVPVTGMTYDAFGRRVEQNNNGTYSQHLYSPIGLVGTMSAQTTTQFRVPLPGGDTSVSGVYFLHKDMLGSVTVASTRGARTVIVDRAFAPYGETYNNIGTLSTDESFTGDRQDIAAGTYDTPNRELNPNQGRWSSPDPAHASWSAYSYSTNPLGETDPSGLNAFYELVYHPCETCLGEFRMMDVANNGYDDGDLGNCGLMGGCFMLNIQGISGLGSSMIGGGSTYDEGDTSNGGPVGYVGYIVPPASQDVTNESSGSSLGSSLEFEVGSNLASPSSLAQTKHDLEALSELEMLSSHFFSKYSQRALVSGGMIFSGAIVAGATATAQVGLCLTTGPFCAVAGIATVPTIAGGLGMAAEGVYYGITGTLWNPSTGKSCGANGCN
jgi:RHS repeat-associated protein